MTWVKYREFIEKTQESDGFLRAGIEIEFTEELCRVMEKQGISRAELARRVGTSPAYITKILRGSTNFTLSTMTKLARAVGMEVRLHLAPCQSRTVWKDEMVAPENWPEESVGLRYRLGVVEPWRAGVAQQVLTRTVGRWTASVSTTPVKEGEQDEGPAHQVA